MSKKKVSSILKKPATKMEIEKLREVLSLTQEKERLALEKERRALADYQNLVRRNQEERTRMARFAALDFVETILEPLGHLSLAAQQINDHGLNMVVDQLWGKLNEAGLEEINPVGQRFDVSTMEAVHTEGSKLGDDGMGLVKKVVTKGYKLNGEVIRHAKVAVE